MIVNRWSEDDAARWRAEAGEDPADRALAERVYSSRLIGAEPDLVMHGGGNTSIKLERPDLFGTPRSVLHIKGSGWDLDTLEAPGMPGVWLEPLRALRALDSLSDEAMVNAQRSNLLDSTAPNPSVETLLHGYLPQRVVDHTHATPFLILANLPHATDIAREIFGDRLGIVPYIMPGFALAKAAAEVYEAQPDVEGLLLLKHGHFAWGDTPQGSYDQIIAHTNEVAAYLALEAPTSLRGRHAVAADHMAALPRLRGALARAAGAEGTAKPVVFDLRNGPGVHEVLARPDLDDLATRGVASPDHVIRVKGKPLVLRECSEAGISAALSAWQAEYRATFERQNARVGGGKTMLAPLPGLVWAPGLGLIGVGATARAAAVAGDLGEQNLRVRAVAEERGGFRPIGEDDLFDMEYWSLEQAKLGKGTPPPFAGQVVLVTGGAGTIGLAMARAFAAQGAAVVLSDRHPEALDAALAALGPGHCAIAQDITAPGAADAAMAHAISHFGGLDILISNAGAATSGAMVDLDDTTFRDAFELNFHAHRAFATAAARLMQAQGTGGQLLFNISKQAVNPGRNFGAYGLPKAATLALMRQMALEHGADGLRVNGVNADRIRSGLLTDRFIAERATARGTDEQSYMAGNLLHAEVAPNHVADAFVALARMERTTAHVLTVDGGNIEAALR